MNEATLDLYINSLLREAGIDAEYQDTDSIELKEALNTASKSQTGEQGRPDYIAVVEGYVLVIEDKKDRDKLCLYDDDGTISQTPKAARDYAVNGAVWYAKKILEHGAYRKIFAFGSAGDPKHHTIKPVFVGEGVIKELDEVSTFTNFSLENIEKYYHQAVLGETLPEDIEHEELRKTAKKLHEDLRNYGNLGTTEKPLVVAGIMLALQGQDYGFRLEQLNGNDTDTDGEILYRQIVNSLKRARVSYEVKRERVLNQFTLIKDRPILNTKRAELTDKTPLKYFAEYINTKIYIPMKVNKSSHDYLGRFYMEFIRYTGGDAQSLGVVITPKHITELFCDLVDLKPDDIIFDPCCGTGGFLIAGMHRMLNAAKNETERKHIKENQIFGIELRDDMFSMATTSMILHGDGQSNITCENFLDAEPSDLQLKGITVGFMNPPYSQARNKKTAHLSELAFTEHLLDSVLKGGRVAVIVPVSAMIGKTKEDRQRKADILSHHTLEGVISLNKNTFYGVGTVPCIAVFTAGEPHQPEKMTKFINFEDDGWIVKMHVGELTETERAKDRKQYLLDCWRGERRDYPSKFMIETTVEAGDEWLHSFYYYHDEMPEEKDFARDVADYLTFEFGTIVQERGYLFGANPISKEKGSDEGISLDGVEWGNFLIGELFTLERGKTIDGDTVDKLLGRTPYVTRTAKNNGVGGFIDYDDTSYLNTKHPVITIGNETAEPFVHTYPFYTGTNINILHPKATDSKNVLLFIAQCFRAQKAKYSYAYAANSKRLKRQKILLPIDEHGQPDYAFMEKFIRQQEQRLIREYVERVSPRLRKAPPPVADLAEVRWGSFFISDVAEILSGRDIYDDERFAGDTPYIGASALNNGITHFVGNTNSTKEAGCISVNRNGSVGYAFYHPYEALYSNDCRKLRLKVGNNPYIALFITTQITAQRGKYNYGYKMGTARLKRQIIMLPVDDEGNPDYAFMEGYIRGIEYRQLEEAVRHFKCRL